MPHLRFFSGLILALSLFSLPSPAQTAIVRHAPTLNGTVDGSVQQLTAENVTFNSNAAIVGDLLVPGVPFVRTNGKPTFGGTLAGTGSASPSNYTITLNGGSRLGHLRTRTDPVAMPTVAAPPEPTGTISVSVNKNGQGPASFANLRNLTLNSNVGPIVVPPGTYGSFVANSGSSFTLGTASASTPAVYNFQNLTLNSNSAIQLAGPAVVTVNGGFSINGSGMGSSVHPEWLQLRIAGGGLTLNSNAQLFGFVTAPGGTITLNSNAQLIGNAVADRLIVNSNGVLRPIPPITAPSNRAPAVALVSPNEGAAVIAPGLLLVSALATDTDGTVSKVEFFIGQAKVGEGTFISPSTYSLNLSSSVLPPGNYSITAAATDNAGASTTSAPISIRILTLPPQPTGPAGIGSGAVLDAATGAPIGAVIVEARNQTGAIQTAANGGFGVTVTDFGGFSNKRATLSFSAPGYITAYRKILAYAGAPVAVDPVYLKKRDSKTTLVGPAGGTATNSRGDLTAEFPAGATSRNLAVQLTNYDGGHELPGILPDSSAFTYAVDLSPEGVVFAQPVTIRIANSLGFAPGTEIPVGVFNPDTVRWEPESVGRISSDGQWVVFQVTHFSARDANVPHRMNLIPGAPDGDNSRPGTPIKHQGNLTVDPHLKERDPGVGISDGTYETEISLPSFEILNREQSIGLVYESEAASGKKLFSFRVADSLVTSAPLGKELNMSVGAAQRQVSYKNAAPTAGGTYHLAQFLDLSNSPSGFYLGTSRITNLYPATYATTSVFGGSGLLDTGVDARTSGRATSENQEWFPWVNRRQSEFGSGWSLAGFDRLHFSPDRTQAAIAQGDGGMKGFRQNVPFIDATPASVPLAVRGLGESADGELLIAHQSGISLRARDGNTQTLLNLNGSNSLDLSSYSVNPSGGVMDAVQADTGTLYFLALVGQEITASSIENRRLGARVEKGRSVSPPAGLFRFTPSTGEIVLVSSNLRNPVALTMDCQGGLYVFDREDRTLSKFDEVGGRTVLAGGIDDFVGLQYDRAGDRIILTRRAGAAVLSPAGQTLFILTGLGGESMCTDVFADREGTFFGIVRTGALSTDIGVKKWNTEGEESGVSELSVSFLLAHNGSVDPAQFHEVTSTKTGDLFYIDNFAVDPIWEAPSRGVSAPGATYLSDSGDGERLSFDAAAQSWRWSDRFGNATRFDVAGYPAERSDRFGSTVGFVYGGARRLVALNYSPGGRVDFEYDAAGRLSAISDIAGRRTTFFIDPQSNLVSSTAPDGGVRRFAYDQDHRIVSKTDPAGQVTRFDLDDQGAYVRIHYPDSTTTSFTAQRIRAASASDPFVGIGATLTDVFAADLVPAGTADEITDQTGQIAAWKLDGRGYLESKRGPAGDGGSTIWDATGRLKTEFDGVGNSTSYSRDAAGNVVSKERFDSSGNSFGRELMEYQAPFSQVTRLVDPNGHATSFTYKPDNGALASIENALGRTTSVDTNALGQVLAVTDPLGRTTSYAYDGSGNLTRVTDAANGSTTFARNAAGFVTGTTDPLGRSTQVVYDVMNRPSSITRADGGIVAYGYDANGNRTSVTDQLGHTTRFEFDAMNRVTKVIAPDNAQETFAYDASGRVATATDPNGNTTRYAYDGSGRRTSAVDPLGRQTAFTLDANGNIVQTIDPLGRVTANEFDAMNRVVATIAPDGGATDFGYDPAGNLIALIDPSGQPTTWSYDSLNRMVSETDPLGHVRTLSYDPAGQRVLETNRRGQQIHRDYDAAGRLAVLDIGTDITTLNHDSAGQLVFAENGSGRISFEYDNAGRMVGSTQPAGALTCLYDLAGNRTRMTDLAGQTAYSFDSRHRLAALTDSFGKEFNFLHDSGSRLSAVGYPNGVVASYAYDPAGDLLSVVHRLGAGTIANAAYGYDASASRISETREDGAIRTFGHDLNDRLTAAHSTTGTTESFAYDRVGDRTTAAGIHNAAHELTEDSSYFYEYDEDGNLTRKQSRTNLGDVTDYSWDALNRLTGARTATTQVNFTYDALGRRASRLETNSATSLTQTTRFLYDGENVRLEISDSGTVLAANTYAGTDRLLARKDFIGGQTHYVHADGSHSTIALTDAAGQVSERYRYSAFGRLSVLDPGFTPRSSEPQVPYTYTGRDWDPALGLYNYRARYYSPTLGRFISADPLGWASGDTNPYAYVGNNPFNLWDPFGLEACEPSNVAEIERYKAATKKQLLISAKLLRETPGIDGSMFVKVKETLDRSSDLLGVAEASGRVEGFLRNNPFGIRIAQGSNLLGAVGIVSDSIGLADGIVNHDTGTIVSSSAGYVMGVGALSANLNGITAITRFNPYTAGASIGTFVALKDYEHKENVKYADGVRRVIDDQLAYINRNLEHLSDLDEGPSR